MAQTDRPILIGSIVHLKNEIPDTENSENGYKSGGYLETRGWITDKPVITAWHDEHIKAFVFTHTELNRSKGSGSWQIISAAGKANGEALLVGDKVHLLNVYSGAGYLDSFEWVYRLEPFKAFSSQMTIGVFTSSAPKRGGGPSGTWTVHSAADKEIKEIGAEIVEDDLLYFENDYPGAGYLHTWNDVTTHAPKDSAGNAQQIFKDYDGERLFVFTAADPQSTSGSHAWRITLTNLAEHLYRIFHQQGDEFAPWRDGGIFKIGDRLGQRVIALDFDFPADKDEGTGSVTYADQENDPIAFTATRHGDHKNRYTIKFSQSTPLLPDGEWQIGAHASQSVTALQIKSPKNITPDADHHKLTGHITYAQGTVLPFEAIRSDDKNSRLLYDYYHPDLLKGRNIKLEGVIDATYRILCSAFEGISQVSLNHVLKKIKNPAEPSIVYATEVKQAEKAYETEAKEAKKAHEAAVKGVLKQHYEDSAEYARVLQKAAENYAAKQKDARRTYAQNLTMAFEKNLTAVINDTIPPSAPTPTRTLLDKNDHTFQIKQLLNLYELSRILNDFFWRELQDEMKQSLENHQRDQTFAPLHLLRRCSQKIATDYQIIQQAAMQRRWQQGVKEKQPTMGVQANELLLMDKLAIKAIAPFQHLLPGQLEHPAIITYLSDRTHIHSLPYTDQFILVGVSYDRVPPAAGVLAAEASTGKEFYAYELMAIPHEVGHYVYQHAVLADGNTFADLSKRFEDNNPYHQWCEEIFADLFGCIVAGPLSVLGMQALLTSIDRERAWKDDEVHPTPAIRFFILTEILRILPDIAAKIQKPGQKPKWGEQITFKNVKKELDRRWAKTIEQWGYTRVTPGEGRPTRIYLPDESAQYLDRLVNVERVINAVEPIIIEFATHLLNAARPIEDNSSGALSTQIPWSHTDSAGLMTYDTDMETLTAESAYKKAPYQTFVQVKDSPFKRRSSDPDIILQQYLYDWGDRGPHGFGDH